MGKKIVIFNGSPRKNGNTSGLIEAFTQGAEQAGNTVTTYFLDGMNIHGCKGCYGGIRTTPNSPCVQKDDMDKIYPDYIAADVLVFASPLYYWTISSQLKTAIDRLFAVSETAVGGRPRKQTVLLMAAEGSGFEESVYWYDRLMRHMGWTSLGKVLAGGVRDCGDIKGHPKLEEARQLGASIR